MSKKSPYHPNIAHTVITNDMNVRGNLSCGNDAWIDAQVEGDITCGGEITIGENANISGNISAVKVKVSGNVKGSITAKESLVCESTAKILGDISTPQLSIEDGAIFNGSASMPEDETIKE